MSLWRLFANLRVRGYQHPYDADAADEVDASTLKLDPILVKGCLWQALLLASEKGPLGLAADMALRAMRGDEEVVKFEPYQPTQAGESLPLLATADKWFAQLVQLQGWNVIRRLTMGENIHCWISGYFAIAKSGGNDGEQLARSILSGGKLSRRCATPPPVNLLELVELLRRMSRLKAKSLTFFHLDLRHWFHQMVLEPGLARLFRILCCGVYFEWLRLPMGWSWSCWICQCLSWLLYLFRYDNEKPLFEDPLDRMRLPRFLTMKKGGFASVLYDNFAVAADDGGVLNEVQTRLLRNLRLFEVIIKEGSHKAYGNCILRKKLSDIKAAEAADPKALHAELPTHLGVQLCAMETGSVFLAWRVDPGKILQWRADSIAKSSTARTYARFVGRIIWAHGLRLRPLYDIEGVLEIARTLGVFVGTQYRRWDTVIELEASQLEMLKATWDLTVKNPWTSCSTVADEKTLYLFTDASDDGWAYVLATPEGHVVDHDEKLFTETQLKWHIFIKEVAAGVWSLAKVAPQHKAFIVEFVDNTAAEAAIEKGFTANRIALELMKRTDIGRFQYSTRRIHTTLNPADAGSRGLPVDYDLVQEVCANTEKYVALGKVGPKKGEYVLRHLEPTYEGSEDDLILQLRELDDDPATRPQTEYAQTKYALKASRWKPDSQTSS